MELRDYLYLDQDRINSYYNQIACQKRMNKKVSSWDWSLSFTGPTITKKNIFEKDEPSLHEKINFIEKQLLKNKKIVKLENALDKWNYTDRKTFFIKTTLEGMRAVIHSTSHDNENIYNGIPIWLFEPIDIYVNPEDDDESVRLRPFLIENKRIRDVDDIPGDSGFTVLSYILTSKEYEKYELHKRLFGDNINFDKNKVRGSLLFKDFAQNPIDYLIEKGIDISDRRKIKSLFRVRHIWDENRLHNNKFMYTKFGLVGYPIYIAEEYK